MAWKIWKTRNKVCFEQALFSAQGIIERGYTQWLKVIKSREEMIKYVAKEARIVTWKKPSKYNIKSIVM